MKCSKCLTDIDKPSKFCPNCGAESEEDSLFLKIHSLAKISMQAGFAMGYLNGRASVSKSSQKALNDFEEQIKQNRNEVLDWYQETILKLKKL